MRMRGLALVVGLFIKAPVAVERAGGRNSVSFLVGTFTKKSFIKALLINECFKNEITVICAVLAFVLQSISV